MQEPPLTPEAAWDTLASVALCMCLLATTKLQLWKHAYQQREPSTRTHNGMSCTVDG
jgi:hypothetical protein